MNNIRLSGKVICRAVSGESLRMLLSFRKIDADEIFILIKVSFPPLVKRLMHHSVSAVEIQGWLRHDGDNFYIEAYEVIEPHLLSGRQNVEAALTTVA